MTRTTTTASAPSAAPTAGIPSFEDLVRAYFDCRRSKRNSATALAFETRLELNLADLHDELLAGTYAPGPSICFVVTHPRPREVWAADFRDRIVHHLLYNHIGDRFERSFIADSCACIKGRGTLYAAQRLEAKVRSLTQNWSRPAFYLKLDLANFFVSIDKRVLRRQLAARIHEPWWLALAHLVLMHDPRVGHAFKGDLRTLDLVPPHKRLALQPAHLGLPIGNLSSQFFANVYLDALDRFVKHELRARHYVRYVDDFVLLHEDPRWLNDARACIEAFLPARLRVHLNPRKTILQPVDRGIDFVGFVIKPWRRMTRRGTVVRALRRVARTLSEELRVTANSYFGLLRQAGASHNDRACLARVVLRRGRTVDARLTRVLGP